MNKLSILIILLACYSCKEEKKLMTYNVTVQKDELNTIGNGYRIVNKEDTIRALDDISAYKRTLFLVEGMRTASKLVSKKITGKEANIYMFYLTDSLGNSVAERLGFKKIDSINKKMDFIPEEVKEKLLFN